MTGAEQFVPPVYACAVGAVLHEHADSTLEPGVLLYTFLPPAAADALRDTEPRVDVHSDGPGASTVTVRALAGDAALSWQLPLAPLVAALPGQSGTDGRMVLLAVVDAEPGPGFWAEPVDCSRLAAELQLPVTELAEALRGRLTPWLQEDLQVLLHDDAHDRALDRSPAQTLAEAVLAQYRGDLEAEQAIGRLLRALNMAPPEYAAELGTRLCEGLVTALDVAPPDALEHVRGQTGPFESEVLRLLDELPPLLAATPPPVRVEEAMSLLLQGPEREETIRGALSLMTRLGRRALGAELADDEVLRQLGLVDDAGLVRLGGLWAALATAAADAGPSPSEALLARIEAEGAPGRQWLRATASVLASLSTEVAGRSLERVAGPLETIRRLLEGEQEVGADTVEACVTLARFVRARGRMGPGAWRQGPAPAAASAVMVAYASGLGADAAVDLLAELLEDDVDGVDLLDGFICATAQVLAQLGPDADVMHRQSQVLAMLTRVTTGARGGRWLLMACLREAPVHDVAAADLTALLPREPVGDPDRAAEKAGRTGMLSAGLTCLEALASELSEEARLPREQLLALVFPTALVEHELLRQV